MDNLMREASESGSVIDEITRVEAIVRRLLGKSGPPSLAYFYERLFAVGRAIGKAPNGVRLSEQDFSKLWREALDKRHVERNSPHMIIRCRLIAEEHRLDGCWEWVYD